MHQVRSADDCMENNMNDVQILIPVTFNCGREADIR